MAKILLMQYKIKEEVSVAVYKAKLIAPAHGEKFIGIGKFKSGKYENE